MTAYAHTFARNIIALALCLITLAACDSEQRRLIDLALDPPKRETIDTSRVGVNNFFVDSQFGGIATQYSDIKNNLGIKHVRVLLAWTNDVQSSPKSAPNFSFYDNILNNIPAGVDVLPVIVHTPDWMANSSNWVAGNPRLTWVEKWLRPVINRYKNVPGIVGWEVWNEPDDITLASDSVLGLTDPANYFELLSLSSGVIRATDPSSLVVVAATRAINQEHPLRINYNQALLELGAVNLVDVWNIHYYGEQFENVVKDNGVKNLLNAIPRPTWITESGQQMPDQQLAYVETAWPFIRREISSIDRIYYYEYASPSPLASNFGLRTNDPGQPVSDLYVYLRDHK